VTPTTSPRLRGGCRPRKVGRTPPYYLTEVAERSKPPAEGETQRFAVHRRRGWRRRGVELEEAGAVVFADRDRTVR